MPYGGPPKEDVGPTQGWSGGPPEAPGPQTRTDAGIQPEGGPAAPRKLDPEEAQRDAEETAGGGAQREGVPGEGDGGAP
jgi:hypothetical protein